MILKRIYYIIKANYYWYKDKFKQWKLEREEKYTWSDKIDWVFMYFAIIVCVAIGSPLIALLICNNQYDKLESKYGNQHKAILHTIENNCKCFNMIHPLAGSYDFTMDNLKERIKDNCTIDYKQCLYQNKDLIDKIRGFYE